LKSEFYYITSFPKCVNVWPHLPKERTSLVWRFYKEDPEYPNKAVCQLCPLAPQPRWPKLISLKGGGTTSMKNHLLSQHRQDYNAVAVPQGGQDGQDGPDGQEQQEARERDHMLVLQYMAKDMRPFSCVEDEGFRSLVKGLKPSINIPSRPYVSKVSTRSTSCCRCFHDVY